MAAATSGEANGSSASSPLAMPLADWEDVALRSWKEAGDDNVGLIAAGVAFYGFLALVPLLGSIVLSYGLIASPGTVVRNMQGLTSVMPADAAKLIGEQLMNVVKTSGEKKGLGVLLALAIALFGARNGAGSVITALNVAYEEKEKRGFIALNLLTLAITGCSGGGGDRCPGRDRRSRPPCHPDPRRTGRGARARQALVLRAPRVRGRCGGGNSVSLRTVA